jgi:hypothetical protein
MLMMSFACNNKVCYVSGLKGVRGENGAGGTSGLGRIGQLKGSIGLEGLERRKPCNDALGATNPRKGLPIIVMFCIYIV